MANKLRFVSICIAAIAGAAVASADQYSWTNWDLSSFIGGPGGSVNGTIASSTHGNIGVTLTGDLNAMVANYPSWMPASTYADGTIVNNAPDSNAIVQLDQVDGTYTLTFSKPVDHMAFAAWSLGNEGLDVTYTFNHDLEFVAGGPSNEYGGQAITTTANSITGHEGNGTVVFDGPFTSLSWTIDTPENWHGFEVGLKSEQTATPEPAAFLPLGMGVLALGIRRRRKG